MKATLWMFFTIVILFKLIVPSVFAQSDYVLPYPSSMPGSKFYKIHVIWEELMKYWYFGNFAQFQYNLDEADKYLVESKTLFEYKQYLLAYGSLKKSDEYFKNLKNYLEKARIEGKDVSQKKNTFKSASLKHIEVLNYIDTIVPNEFIWKPEKSLPIELKLKDVINSSIIIRNKYMD